VLQGEDAPMTYDIRPLSFGEILDRAFRVYLDHFWLLFGISALVSIPAELLLKLPHMGAWASGTLVFAYFFVALPVQHTATIAGISKVYLGRRSSIGDAYTTVPPIVFAVVGTYLMAAIAILVGFIIATIVIGLFVGGIAAALGARVFPTLPLPFTIVFVIMLGVVVGYLAARWLLIGPVMVIERRFGRSALRRSSELLRGAKRQALGIVAAAFLISFVPILGLRFVWSFIPVVGVVLKAATGAVGSGYSMLVIVIYYFDRRCRIEDFDLRLLAEQVRTQGQPVIEPSSEASAPA
jgi:hypothetical protein